MTMGRGLCLWWFVSKLEALGRGLRLGRACTSMAMGTGQTCACAYVEDERVHLQVAVVWEESLRLHEDHEAPETVSDTGVV